MKIFLLILSFCLAIAAFAQKREEIFDYSFKPSNFGSYYYVITEKQDSLWYRKAYYVSKKTQAMEGWYKDEDCKIAHGNFTWYHPTRFMKSQGRYTDGKKEGVWLEWNEEGHLVDSSTFKDGKRSGISLRWHNNGMPKDSIRFDDSGNGVQVSWYNDGFLASAGRWIQDTLKNGRWNFYDKNGQVIATEDYAAGKQVACACYDEKGTKLDSTACAEKEAEPNGGIAGWRRFLQQNLTWLIEDKAKVLKPGQYTVTVRFMVEKDGTLTDFTAYSTYGQGLEESVIQLLKRSPRWTPGRQRGRAVRSYHTQPVIFRIDEK